MKLRFGLLLVLIPFLVACDSDGPGATGPMPIQEAPLPTPSPSSCTTNSCSGEGDCTDIPGGGFSCDCNDGYSGETCGHGCSRPTSIQVSPNGSCTATECSASFGVSGDVTAIARVDWTFSGVGCSPLQSSARSITPHCSPIATGIDWSVNVCCDDEGTICNNLGGFYAFPPAP